MNAEPGLRFWLEYVERSGALREEDADGALVLLTRDLRRALDLPESVSVTSDPGVAAEDGSLLLIPGHPAVDAAARAVLREGDAGWGFLPWPRAAAPDGATLLAKAREAVWIEHGRIDPRGAPAAAYLPVLRVGSLVTYTLSDRFQEREEMWVDGLHGLPLPEQARVRISAAGGSGPAGGPAGARPGHGRRPARRARTAGAAGRVARGGTGAPGGRVAARGAGARRGLLRRHARLHRAPTRGGRGGTPGAAGRPGRGRPGGGGAAPAGDRREVPPAP